MKFLLAQFNYCFCEDSRPRVMKDLPGQVYKTIIFCPSLKDQIFKILCSIIRSSDLELLKIKKPESIKSFKPTLKKVLKS